MSFALVFSGAHTENITVNHDSFKVSRKHHHRVHVTHRHKPRVVISDYDLCVANRENGEPGALTYDTIDWYVVNEYYGAYSFLHSTWVTAGGLRYAYNANEATPTEQSRIFDSYSARDPGAWPNTVPPCLYLR